MKTTTRSLLALTSVLSALAISPMSAKAPGNPDPFGYRVRSVEQSGNVIVEPGTSQMTVRRLLGEPGNRFDANTWVYHGYRAVPQQQGSGCGMLVITFKAGTVARILLVNNTGVDAIAASLKPAPAKGMIASN
jgi:outer membrane protein assembly factor BamE (lipoprotein component of BamABCDE complex)